MICTVCDRRMRGRSESPNGLPRETSNGMCEACRKRTRYKGHPGALPLRERPWLAEASCSPVTADLFDSEGSRQDVAYAKAICSTCPVREDCLSDAFRSGDEWTFRGGMTAQQRRAVTREALRALPLDMNA